MRKRVITRNAIRCKKCGKICESTSVHEFVKCDCAENWVAADGGHEYLRRVGDPNNWEDLSETKEIEYTACQDCYYYDGDPKYSFAGECILLDCSTYGDTKSCKYFREEEVENGED